MMEAAERNYKRKISADDVLILRGASRRGSLVNQDLKSELIQREMIRRKSDQPNLSRRSSGANSNENKGISHSSTRAKSYYITSSSSSSPVKTTVLATKASDLFCNSSTIGRRKGSGQTTASYVILNDRILELSSKSSSNTRGSTKRTSSITHVGDINGGSKNTSKLETPMIRIQQPSVDYANNDLSESYGEHNNKLINLVNAKVTSNKSSSQKDNAATSSVHDNLLLSKHKSNLGTSGINNKIAVESHQFRRYSDNHDYRTKYMMIKNRITSPRHSADNIYSPRMRRKSSVPYYEHDQTQSTNNSPIINPHIRHIERNNSVDSLIPEQNNGPWTHRRSLDTSFMYNKDLWVRCGKYELPLTMRDSWYDNSSDSNLQAAVRASLRRSVCRRSSEPIRPIPPCPPSPALQHLTNDELHKLNEVITKQEEFEQEENNRTIRLQKELRVLEEKVRQASTTKSVLKQVDIRLCRLCYKTKFADGIGRACYDCHRRVCNRCGTFSKSKWDFIENKLIRGKWRCSLCHKRREILMATGMWYHGDDAQPTFNSSVFQKKIGDPCEDGDMVVSGEPDISDSSCRRDYHTVATDSEMSAYSTTTAGDESKTCSRRLPRRRLLSSEEFSDLLDDEEIDMDDEQFLIEREKCRRERIKFHIGRKKSRKVSVGTSTNENGIITGDVPNMVELDCPMHGRNLSPSSKERKVSFKDENKGRRVHLVNDKISGNGKNKVPQRKQGVFCVNGGPYSKPSEDRQYLMSEVDKNGKANGNRTTSTASDTGIRSVSNSLRKTSHSSSKPLPTSPTTPRYKQQNGKSKQALANMRTIYSTDCLELSAKSENKTNFASSRLDHRQSSVDDLSSPANTTHNSRKISSSPRKPKVAAEVYMSKRSVSLEEEMYTERLHDKELNKSESHKPVGHSVIKSNNLKPQKINKSPARGIPKHLDDQGVRRTSSDGKKYSHNASSKRLYSQYSVDKQEPMYKTEDGWHKIKNTSNNTSQNKRAHYKQKMSMYFASVEDGLSPSPSVEFNNTNYSNNPEVKIKVQNASFQDYEDDHVPDLSFINSSPSHHGASSSVKGAVRGSSGSGASYEHVPLYHIQNVALCHTSTTECDESASSVSSSNAISTRTTKTKVPVNKSTKRPYLQDRSQSYADEVSFDGLPSFLTNPITSEDQMKQEYLLPIQSMSSFRNEAHGNQEKVKLCKNPNEGNCRTNGLGMVVIGGKVGLDGKLSAYVTEVIAGGSADMSGICVGDQILEWDGSNLVDATYEEVREVMERSGDNVQLLVMYNRHLQNPKYKDDNSGPGGGQNGAGSDQIRKNSAHESLESLHLTGHYGRRTGGLNGVLPSDIWNPKPIKRTLPRTPDEIKRLQSTTNGKIEIRLWYDRRVESLAINIIRAKDLYTTLNNSQAKNSKIIARVSIIPVELARNTPENFLECRHSSEPCWDQTIVYREFGRLNFNNKAFEVTIWQEDTRCQVTFIGEVVLDLDQTNTNDEILWYDLENHDENNGELVYPKRTNEEHGFKYITPTADDPDTWQSLPSIPSTPAHDIIRKILNRKNISGKTFLPMRSFSQEDKGIQQRDSRKPSSPCESKVDKLRRRVSHVMTKVGAKLVDRRSKSLEYSENTLQVKVDEDARRHSETVYPDPEKGKELLSPQVDSRKSSKSSASSVPCSALASTVSSDAENNSILQQTRQGPEGDDITSLLGPAQVPPKPSEEKLVQGDLRLAFIITKGQLEIDVICAKGLSKNAQQQPPDTYVKTYLCGNKKRIQNKKTRIVKGSTDPLYRQKIKYSACNVHGRYMQILVKEKFGNFGDKNPCLGEVLIKLDNLELTTHTMGWYKLFKESATELGSTESL